VSILTTPAYWKKACAQLSAADPIMAGLISRCPQSVVSSRGDPFQTLARAIVGQQISVKAAASVWQRVVDAVGEVLPENFLAKGLDGLVNLGLSQRKKEYLLDLARHFDEGLLHVEKWPSYDDEVIIQELIAVRGIGRWSAEMFLMFNLMRPNILPLDDVGLLRAVEKHYFDGIRPTRKQVVEVAKAWQPWCTVATWYFWRSLEPVASDY
jgi:DNA-3-methyladenine glycosylase II